MLVSDSLLANITSFSLASYEAIHTFAFIRIYRNELVTTISVVTPIAAGMPSVQEMPSASVKLI